MLLDDLKNDKEAPEWLTSQGYITLKGGYLLYGETPKQGWARVAVSVAKYLNKPELADKFFNYMWKGWLCLSTPIFSNCGTERGLPISCNSIHVGDSVDSIFNKQHELAMLSKHGAGVGVYFGDVRGRGANITGNGRSEGVIPWMKCYDSVTSAVSQGSVRRGATAIYLPIEHVDIEEFLRIRRPEGDPNRQCLNLHHAVTVPDTFMQKVEAGDNKARDLWKEVSRSRFETGEPYILFTDNVNKANPECYTYNGLSVKTSNICNEIMLHTDTDHSFVCCLSSLNLTKWEEWKNTDLVQTAIWFLDGVLTEYITKAADKPGFEASVRSAIKGRALGLGALGWHTLLQQKSIAFESFDAMMLNRDVFKHIREEAEKATIELAKEYGEPEWCKGFKRRNSHLCVAPNTKLLTKQGHKEIKDLEGKDIEIWNGHEWSEVRPFKTSDNSELLEFILSDGSILKTTLYHKWLIKNNRFRKSKIVEAIDLKIGDKLEKWELPIIEGTEELKHAYTGGFFTGDGSYNQSKPQYRNCHKRKEIRMYNDDKKCIKDFAIKEGCTIRTQKDGSLRAYIKDDVSEKYVVPGIQYTIKSRLEWLGGLFDADGSNCGSITSAKRAFLIEIKEMLSYCGVLSKVVKVKRTGGYGKDFYYILLISQVDLNKLIKLGLKTNRVQFPKRFINKQEYIKIVGIKKIDNSETYCLTEPKRGTALFNGIKTLQCAVAPTVSNSIISGNVSAGIEPLPANAYAKKTAKGVFIEQNPQLMILLEKLEKNTPQVWNEIATKDGSVQHLEFLSDHEKEVFKTAYEINQMAIIQQAAQRQKFIDQGQSLNLFFPSNTSAKEFNSVHMEAWRLGIKGLYYLRSSSVLKADISSRTEDKDCKACES